MNIFFYIRSKAIYTLKWNLIKLKNIILNTNIIILKLTKKLKVAALKDQSRCVYLFLQQPKPGKKTSPIMPFKIFCKNKINLTKDATILLRRTISRNVK